MTVLQEILSVAFVAALAENAFFTRCFAVDMSDLPASEEEFRLKNYLDVVMTVLAALAGYLGRLIFSRFSSVPKYFGTPVSIFIYVLFFFAVFAAFRFTRQKLIAPELLEKNVKCCFSFLQIGVLLLINLGSYNWYESLVFGLFSALGFILAERVYMVMQDRLQYSRVSFFLRGLPIRLIGIGIFSLALFGLLGHSLAV